MEIRYHANTAGYCVLFIGAEFGDRLAISAYNDYRCHRYTYKQLFALSIMTAGLLLDIGARKGDRIMVCAENGVEYALLYFAAAFLGLIVVPVDFNTSADTLRRLYSSTRPQCVFTSRQDWLEELGGEQQSSRVRNIEYLLEDINDYPSTMSELAKLHPDVNDYIDSSDPYLEIFTSGTTSDPKVVQLTHRNIVSNLTNFRKLVFVPENHRMLSMAPLSHALGLTMGLYTLLSYGANIVYIKNLNSTNIMRVMEHDHIDAVLTVPAFLNILKDKIEDEMAAAGKLDEVRQILPKMLKLPIFVRRLFFRSLIQKLGGNLKWIATGASALNPEVGNFWEAVGIRVTQGYGLSECLVVSISDFPWRRMGTVGKPLPNQHLRLDENNEIWVAGPHVFTGYKGQEEHNSEVFSGGWYRTGDIGRLDGDGHLTIMGRSKNVIITPTGLNIYPEDIESAIEVLHEVQDCVVVNMPEREGDLYLVAFVVLRQGPCVTEQSLEALRDRVNEQLSSHQKVAKIVVWDDEDFPRTPSQKIKRGQIIEIYQRGEMKSDAVEPPSCDEDESDVAESHSRRVRALIASIRKTDVSQVTGTARLISDLGFDSLQLTELIAAIEAALCVTVSADVFNQDLTVSELIELVDDGTVENEHSRRVFQVSALERVILALNRGLTRAFFPSLFRSIFDLKINNREILKQEVAPALRERGHVIIANHNSHLDSISIFCTFPYRLRGKLVAAAAEDYFFSPENRRAYYLLQSTMRAFPLRRTANPKDFFRSIGVFLDRGDSVLIYPEGTRSRTGELGAFLPSVGQLLREVDAPVVPLFLYGTHELWPPHQERPKLGSIAITVNAPMDFSRRRDPYDIRDQLHELFCSEFPAAKAEECE